MVKVKANFSNDICEVKDLENGQYAMVVKTGTTFDGKIVYKLRTSNSVVVLGCNSKVIDEDAFIGEETKVKILMPGDSFTISL